MKTCTACRVEKPIGEFSPTGKDGRYVRSRCKPCNSAYARKWAKDNASRHREARYRRELLATYRITLEQYEQMLADQRGVCAICGQDEPVTHGRTGTKFRLSIDHDHETGRVRGLLCQKCNRAIGLLGDNVELLRAAIRYLERV